MDIARSSDKGIIFKQVLVLFVAINVTRIVLDNIPKLFRSDPKLAQIAASIVYITPTIILPLIKLAAGLSLYVSILAVTIFLMEKTVQEWTGYDIGIITKVRTAFFTRPRISP